MPISVGYILNSEGRRRAIGITYYWKAEQLLASDLIASVDIENGPSHPMRRATEVRRTRQVSVFTKKILFQFADDLRAIRRSTQCLCEHGVSDRGRLFQQAIAESGAYTQFQDYFNFIVPLATGETVGTPLVPPGTSVATSVGCPIPQTVECLRAVPAPALVLEEPGTIYPFVDGTILTQTPSAAFSSGQFNRVPVISGGNHDEWRIVAANQFDFAGAPLTDPEYPAAVAGLS